MKIRMIATSLFGIVYLPVFGFFAFVGIWNSNPAQALIFLAAIALFFLLSFRVVKQKRIPKRIAGFFAVALGLLWSFQSVRRVIFVLTEGGMERSDGHGSPLAFILGIAAEFFLLGLPAVGLLLIALFHRNPSEAYQDAVGNEGHLGAN